MNFVRFASYELDPSIRVDTDFSCSFPLQVRTNGVPLWTFFEEKKYYLYRIEYLCSENYRVEKVLELKIREILSFHEVRFASRSKSKLTLKRKIPSGGGISKDSHARLISWRKNVDCAKLRVGNRSVRGGRTLREKLRFTYDQRCLTRNPSRTIDETRSQRRKHWKRKFPWHRSARYAAGCSVSSDRTWESCFIRIDQIKNRNFFKFTRKASLR